MVASFEMIIYPIFKFNEVLFISIYFIYVPQHFGKFQQYS